MSIFGEGFISGLREPVIDRYPPHFVNETPLEPIRIPKLDSQSSIEGIGHFLSITNCVANIEFSKNSIDQKAGLIFGRQRTCPNWCTKRHVTAANRLFVGLRSMATSLNKRRYLSNRIEKRQAPKIFGIDNGRS